MWLFKTKAPQPDPEMLEEFVTLSAIWIMASNDENPEISYRGLQHRLALKGTAKVRKLVADHPELFRGRIPEGRLTDLKTRYQDRKGNQQPSGLRELPDEERNTVIGGLTVRDFFRSQFRARESAERSEIAIIDWGLTHIERLRKAYLDQSEVPLKQFSNRTLPLLSVLFSTSALLLTGYGNYINLEQQNKLKALDLEYPPKIAAYTTLIKAASTAFDAATKKDHNQLQTALNEIDLAASESIPFLTPAAANHIKTRATQFSEFCRRVEATNSVQATTNQLTEEFRSYRDDFGKSFRFRN